MREAGFGPPQAENFGVFWALLDISRGNASKSGPFGVHNLASKKNLSAPLFSRDVDRRGGRQFDPLIPMNPPLMVSQNPADRTVVRPIPETPWGEGELRRNCG